jgi:ABC-type antimicrobial peptide transport system permease subunit
LSLFGGLALFLAGVGIYGIIGYAVSQRTREIGVRMAMGAEPRQVLRMVLCEGLKLVLTGLSLGVAAALMLMRLLEGLVYGVSMRDPLIFIIVNLVMLFVAMLACYFPARRAARVDPLVALRYE